MKRIDQSQSTYLHTNDPSFPWLGILQRALAAAQDHHDRRMAKLRELIEERRQSVADHDSGHRRLSGEEYERATRQLQIFQRKLVFMQDTNTPVGVP
jgi:hypothetical protein